MTVSTGGVLTLADIPSRQNPTHILVEVTGVCSNYPLSQTASQEDGEYDSSHDIPCSSNHSIITVGDKY